MHHLIAAFFAMIFSFGSAQPVHHADAFVAHTETASSFDQAIPTHQQILAGDYAEASYPETGCECQATISETNFTSGAR